MVQLKIGDIFEIVTSNGIGLFQYVHRDESVGELIRLFSHLYEERNIFLNERIVFSTFSFRGCFKCSFFERSEVDGVLVRKLLLKFKK